MTEPTPTKMQILGKELDAAFAKIARLRIRLEVDLIDLERAIVNARAEIEAITDEAKQCLRSP